MAEVKTKKNAASVSDFIAAVPDKQQRDDAGKVLALMKEVAGEKPWMWGTSIIGFGSYKAKSGEWPIVGFSPRKQNLVLYIMAGFDAYSDLLAKLGRHSTGKGCLYVKRLADVDAKVLRAIVARSVARVREKHPN